MKIMVVDDEQDVKVLFEQRFRREIRSGKIEFHFAFSGEGGLEYLENNGTAKLVLILSDINMPGMNGLELLKKIKERYPKLPVFMITAYGDEHNYQMAMDYGAEAYFDKPIDFDDLKNKIQALGPP